MTTGKKQRWQFAVRFRRNAFGWRSQQAIQRVREAVSEIRRAARSARRLIIYRAIVRKYPHKGPERILRDLVARTPAMGANGLPLPRGGILRIGDRAGAGVTVFALEAGLAPLHWLENGYGYDITGADVWAAYSNVIKATVRPGQSKEH